MNENSYIYLVYADDTTMCIDNSYNGDWNVFKRLVFVEFRRAKPIDRISLLKRKEPVYTDDFVNHGFELYEAKELIKELSRSDRWVNIHLERKDIDELYKKNLLDLYTCAKLIEDRETGKYSFENMTIDSGLEVQLTLTLTDFDDLVNIDDRESYKTELKKRTDPF